ncbi:MAG: single-stranded DNA-binding protein [Candidatus Binatia bacterium]
MNRVDLAGTVASMPERRTTPAGTPVLQFRLQVEPSPHDPAIPGCLLTVVALGESAAATEVVEGSAVEIVGSLTERRWRGPGAVRQSRFEILARSVRVL